MPQEKNLTMLCDFYELTMAYGYFKTGLCNKITYFDVFFRGIPDNGGFAIAAGLEQIVDYVKNLHFSPQDIEYLRGKGLFDEEFLNYLKEFRFTGDIYAIPEGTPVFPYEPLITVCAPAIEAQLIETYLLLQINHQSLIATKASRIVRSAAGSGGAGIRFPPGPGRRRRGAGGAGGLYRRLRRHGLHPDATELYGVPAGGTMAHSWVQMFDTEYDAFRTYCEIYPHNATLLVDTYDTLRSGVPNAIRVFKEVLLPQGITDLRYPAGFRRYCLPFQEGPEDAGRGGAAPTCKIVASNSLDEYLIRDLMMQGAQIDTFGVGERLITAKSDSGVRRRV